MDSFERCWCMGVTASQVHAAVVAGCAPTVDAVRQATGACGGCRTCRPELEAFLTGLAPSPGQCHDGQPSNEGAS